MIVKIRTLLPSLFMVTLLHKRFLVSVVSVYTLCLQCRNKQKGGNDLHGTYDFCTSLFHIAYSPCKISMFKENIIRVFTEHIYFMQINFT